MIDLGSEQAAFFLPVNVCCTNIAFYGDFLMFRFAPNLDGLSDYISNHCAVRVGHSDNFYHYDL